MGQRIQEYMRPRVLDHPLVRAVTDQHIELKDGRWVDPAEFVVAERPCFFIDKFITCWCYREARVMVRFLAWESRHDLTHEHAGRVGEHVKIRGRIKTLATGVEVWERLEEHPFCPQGNWAEEERVDGIVCCR